MKSRNGARAGRVSGAIVHPLHSDVVGKHKDYRERRMSCGILIIGIMKGRIIMIATIIREQRDPFSFVHFVRADISLYERLGYLRVPNRRDKRIRLHILERKLKSNVRDHSDFPRGDFIARCNVAETTYARHNTPDVTSD